MPPTTPTTRPPLPRYNVKRIGNADLLEAIDQVNLKLCEALTLVNSISSQTTRMAPMDYHRSTRPTRVTTHEQLETDLMITVTPEGQTI